MENMSESSLKRYIQMREKTDYAVDQILLFCSLLSLFKDGCNDSLGVDLQSVGKAHDIMLGHAWDILEELERFMSLEEARMALGEP